MSSLPFAIFFFFFSTRSVQCPMKIHEVLKTIPGMEGADVAIVFTPSVLLLIFSS